MINSLSESQKITNLKDLRDFLEAAYKICYDNPNVLSNNIKNTTCYKISILGTYIPPILGSLATQDMESMFAAYGSPKDSIGSTGPPEPGVITSTQDYIMLLQLYIAASNLKPFSSGKFPLWKQDIERGKTEEDSTDTATPNAPTAAPVDKTIVTDLCENQEPSESAIIGYAGDLYTIIQTSLQHFHNQIENTNHVFFQLSP
jgi:hypothetical protein